MVLDKNFVKPMQFDNVGFTGIYGKTWMLTMWKRKKKSNNIKRIIREINLHSVLAKIPSNQLHIGILTVWKWVIKNDYDFKWEINVFPSNQLFC